MPFVASRIWPTKATRKPHPSLGDPKTLLLPCRLGFAFDFQHDRRRDRVGQRRGQPAEKEALALLTELCRHYLATEKSHRGLLREACYSRPHKEGVASAVMFGDYFFAEALCSVVMPGKLRATPMRLSA